jgi:hypothetical protein
MAEIAIPIEIQVGCNRFCRRDGRQTDVAQSFLLYDATIVSGIALIEIQCI